MVWFLMIPLALVAITIAIAPVLAMTVVECRKEAADAVRRGPTVPGRIPWNLGGVQPIALHDDAAVRQERARAA